MLALSVLVTNIAYADHLPGIDPIVAGGIYDHTDHSGHDHSGEDLGDVSFVDANLAGTDFSGTTLSRATLTRSNATGASFVGALLDMSILVAMNVTGADFTGADLTDAVWAANTGVTDTQLRSALSLQGIDLHSGSLDGFDLSGLDLRNAYFRYASLTATNFGNTDLTGARIRNTTLAGTDFTNANLTDTEAYNLDLSTVNLTGADLTRARLYGSGVTAAQLRSAASVGAILLDVNYAGEDLSGIDFSGADLRDAILIGSDLSGSSFVGAILWDVDLTGADLTDADLSYAENLTSAQLLSAATLAGANLGGHSFWETNLTGVDLTGAQLTNVDFRRADLSGVIGLSLATFDSLSWYDAATVFPPGFDPIAKGLTAYGSLALHATVTEIVSSGDDIPIPEWPEKFGDYPLALWAGGIDLNDAGQVAFSGSSYVDAWLGVYLGEGGPITALATPFEFPPGPPGYLYSFNWFPRGEPALNNVGEVAFNHFIRFPAELTFGGSVFFVSSGVGSRIAYQGDPVPVAGVDFFTNIPYPNCIAMNNAGRILFHGAFTEAGGGAGAGIFSDVGGVQSPIFLSGETAPGTGGGTFELGPFGPCGQVNESGDVVAAIDVVGGTVGGGIFRDSGGVDSAVVLLGDPAPGTGGGTYADFPRFSTFDYTISSGPQAWINATGDVLFVASVAGGTVDYGIFVDSGGVQRLVAAPGQPAPGTGMTYDKVESPSMNDAGLVVFKGFFNESASSIFTGFFDESASGIFMDIGGIHVAVVLSGESVPDESGRIYGKMGPPSINSAAAVAFSAVTDTAVTTDAIFLLPEPTLGMLVSSGILLLAGLARRSARRAF